MVEEEVSRKKKSCRRKKRISKHVLDAQTKRRAQEQLSTNESNNDIQKTSSNTMEKSKERNSSSHVKDPLEVRAYLLAWKESPSDWKFNKNSQSWLIRHAYHVDKVPKSTFVLLISYLDGLKGGSMRTRILNDATRRVLRYKTWFTQQQQQTQQTTDQDEGILRTSSKQNHNQTKQEESGKITNDDGDCLENDDSNRWKGLNDHDKRLEYKRARKLLDELTTNKK